MLVCECQNQARQGCRASLDLRKRNFLLVFLGTGWSLRSGILSDIDKYKKRSEREGDNNDHWVACSLKPKAFGHSDVLHVVWGQKVKTAVCQLLHYAMSLWTLSMGILRTPNILEVVVFFSGSSKPRDGARFLGWAWHVLTWNSDSWNGGISSICILLRIRQGLPICRIFQLNYQGSLYISDSGNQFIPFSLNQLETFSVTWY